MPQLKAAEILAHPEFGKVPWEGKATEEGFVDVAKGRGGPISIAYEIHGTGPNKLVWIMGLGAFKTAWWRQTRHFGHTHGTTYTSLTLDNRGMGLSSKPLIRYSTSEMARDVLELLEHLGWIPSSTTTSPSPSLSPPPKPKTQLNIIGVSMGGMIAQELALLLPPHTVSSLILVSTAPRLVNEVGFVRNLRDRINLFIPRDPDTQLADTKRRLFNPAFLEEPDCDAYVDPATGEKAGWPTNGDRFAGGELRKRQDTTHFTRLGFTLQAIAAGWHHKTPTQLATLITNPSSSLSGRRARIAVVHGTADGMISFTHAKMLRDAFAGADRQPDAVGQTDHHDNQGSSNSSRGSSGEDDGWRRRDEILFAVFEGKGHMLPWEVEGEFNALVAEMVSRGNRL